MNMNYKRRKSAHDEKKNTQMTKKTRKWIIKRPKVCVHLSEIDNDDIKEQK